MGELRDLKTWLADGHRPLGRKEEAVRDRQIQAKLKFDQKMSSAKLGDFIRSTSDHLGALSIGGISALSGFGFISLIVVFFVIFVIYRMVLRRRESTANSID